MNKEDKGLLGIALVVAVGIVIGINAWGASIYQPVKYPLKGPFSQTVAMVIAEKRAFGVVRSVDTSYNRDSLDRQPLLGNDTSWLLLYKIYPNLTDSALGITIQRNLRRSSGNYGWNLAAYWSTNWQKVVRRTYVSTGTSVIELARETKYNLYRWDTILTVAPVFEYDCYFDLYEDSTAAFPTTFDHWSSRSDTMTSTGSGTLPSPGTPQQCAIYGYVHNLSAIKGQYVTVTITLPENVYDSCAGGTIFGNKIVRKTDESGYWGLTPTVSVPWSACLAGKSISITLSGYGYAAKTQQFKIPSLPTYEVKW